jgi:hypothetical protein
MSRALNIHQLRKQRRKSKQTAQERPVLQLPIARPVIPSEGRLRDEDAEEAVKDERGVAVIDFYV